MMHRESDPYHLPVLVEEVAQLLITNPVGAYLDLTLGGGGHLKALAARLDEKARLYGTDKDSQALERAALEFEGVPQKTSFTKATFGELEKFGATLGEEFFDGILIDLGLSSRQIDDPSRGFSFMADGPLDMRFDSDLKVSAADMVNEVGAKELVEIISNFGEERKAAKIAEAIVATRTLAPITTTRQLADIVRSVVPERFAIKSLARVFQAFRIAVNSELKELDRVLPAAANLLAPGGRLAVISYHSLEDRIVKRFFAEQSRPKDDSPFLIPDNQLPPAPMKQITSKPIIPSKREAEENVRARSAKLRVAEKI